MLALVAVAFNATTSPDTFVQFIVNRKVSPETCSGKMSYVLAIKPAVVITVKNIFTETSFKTVTLPAKFDEVRAP